MPPKRKAPAAATAARPVRARKSNTEPVPSAPTLAVAPQPLPRFIHLPTKVLDRIKTHVQAPSDVLSLAQTCQAFWKKWGRPDDWPKQHFYSDHQGPVLFSRHGYVPLFYLAGAKPGEPGHSPFYIQGLEFQGDDGFSLVAAQIGLHHLGPNAELDYGRWEREVREDDWGNDGGLGPERCWDLDWFQNRHKMMTATPAWIHKHFPCQTCNGTFVVRNGDAQLEAEFPELKGFSKDRYELLKCPRCVRGYPNGTRTNVSHAVHSRLHRFDPVSGSDGGWSDEYGRRHGYGSDEDDSEDDSWNDDHDGDGHYSRW